MKTTSFLLAALILSPSILLATAPQARAAEAKKNDTETRQDTASEPKKDKSQASEKDSSREKPAPTPEAAPKGALQIVQEQIGEGLAAVHALNFSAASDSFSDAGQKIRKFLKQTEAIPEEARESLDEARQALASATKSMESVAPPTEKYSIDLAQLTVARQSKKDCEGDLKNYWAKIIPETEKKVEAAKAAVKAAKKKAGSAQDDEEDSSDEKKKPSASKEEKQLQAAESALKKLEDELATQQKGQQATKDSIKKFEKAIANLEKATADTGKEPPLAVAIAMRTIQDRKSSVATLEKNLEASPSPEHEKALSDAKKLLKAAEQELETARRQTADRAVENSIAEHGEKATAALAQATRALSAAAAKAAAAEKASSEDSSDTGSSN